MLLPPVSWAMLSEVRPGLYLQLFEIWKRWSRLSARRQCNALRNLSGTGTKKMPHFKKIGMNTVRFAVAQPMLFRLLFMRETSASVGFEGIYPRLGKTADECISDIRNDYCLDESEAQRLFESMWIYTFGIGALCAMRVCVFSEEELSAMLSYEFEALLLSAKRRN